MATDPQQQVMPRHGGAAATVSGAPTGFAARVTVPTVEFPGGVDPVPMRHTVPSVTLGAPISAVACSFEPADSFVELARGEIRASVNRRFVHGFGGGGVPSLDFRRIIRESTWWCFGGPLSAGGGVRCSAFWPHA
ncbi:hypothetical protein CYMTET_49851 [Cymbomonas tetramitiformis]|uniref:Uncharacterized protein n=1 Tax=Cymbomonas tetramitiformis TaxID=36881 RepID=A0AAE0BQJ2_9CHLO|nr:hypothetical protein CYMTET_49851 [Cymbomonas tetramitiformis]